MRLHATTLAALLATTIPASADQAFSARLAGHAILPAATFFDPPADAPADLAVSGKFTAPDRKRVDAVGTIMGTSFLSANDAPRPTGIKLPFKGQPLQGLSGIKSMGDGTFWMLLDNGFGSKVNSADAMLTLHRLRPDWAKGTVERLEMVFLHDPDKKLPFPITLEGTPKRYLTGADLDIESFQPIADSIWVGRRVRSLPHPRGPHGQGDRLLRDHRRRQGCAFARSLHGLDAGRAGRGRSFHRAPLSRLRRHGRLKGRPLPLPSSRRAAMG